MYQQQQQPAQGGAEAGGQQPGGEAGQGPTPGGEDVVDGEFKNV